MKVVLPDKSELELPDGATGLDAARAIGPKLAEEAVLVRSNGRVQDLRLPLQDGQPIQILTTRDKDDPDALYVLRHSSAHLLAEAVRRLYPGVKIAPGPPFWHPKGMVVWNELEDLRRRENLRRDYVEVKTPLLYDVETYITSGHYDNYRENMFFVQGKEDEKPLALKPMNCPGHMLLFGSALRSYRDLPLR